MWINVSELPDEGRMLILDDPDIWAIPMKEFGIACTVTVPLRGELLILPQSGEKFHGCLIRGRLSGEVTMPCNCCAEDAHVVIDSSFESFEPFPAEHSLWDKDEPEDIELYDTPDEQVVRLIDGVPQINPAALLWQELVLVLPVKPLCHPDCKGLCPVCGQNRNTGSCACAADKGDPRLAALRNLTLAKKQ